MNRLLSLAFAFAVLASPAAQAGAVLGPGAELWVYNEARWSGYQANYGEVYNDQPSEFQGSQPSISVQSTQSYVGYSIPNLAHMSATANGTVTVSPGPGDFTSLQLNLAASTSNAADGSRMQDAIQYSASITVSQPTFFSMTGDSNTTTTFNDRYPLRGSDNSLAGASLTDSNGVAVAGDGSQVYNYRSDLYSTSSSTPSGKTTVSGLLQPGTYQFYATAQITSSVDCCEEFPNVPPLVDNASLALTLTLTPVPEPASLTLFFLGGLGMVLARRRRLA